MSDIVFIGRDNDGSASYFDRVAGDVYNSGQPPTVDELAEAAGLESFDTALPLTWVRKVEEELSYMQLPNLSGHIVWCYDDYPGGKLNVSGYPVALSPEGQAVLGALALHATRGM